MVNKTDKTETMRASETTQGEAKSKKRDVSAETAARREAALDLAAVQFKALGDPTRLRILRFLSGDIRLESATADAATLSSSPAVTEPEEASTVATDGWTVGDVSLGVFGKSKVSSTLSHHLKELRNAGLITMKRRGKNLMCRVHAESVAALRCHLTAASRPVTRKKVTEVSEATEPNFTVGTLNNEFFSRSSGTRITKMKMKEGVSSDDSHNYANHAATV